MEQAAVRHPPKTRNSRNRGMDIASWPWLNPSMRSSLLALCGLLLSFSATMRAQATWNFSAATGAPASLPANISGGVVSALNLGSGSLGFNPTSPSSGYTGASAGNNASVAAQGGTLAVATSAYFEFTLTPISNFSIKVSVLSIGSRSTATGPTTLTLFSSADAFAAPLGTATVLVNSTWTLANFSNLNLTPTAGAALTFRIYGSGGSGTGGGNWRVDDISLSFVGPTIAQQPVSLAVNSGQRHSAFRRMEREPCLFSGAGLGTPSREMQVQAPQILIWEMSAVPPLAHMTLS